MSSVVYFIRAKAVGMVKIGFSIGLARHLSDLQLGSPVQLEVVATMPGGREVEASLHTRFIKSRAHGEWFRWGPDIERCVTEINAGLYAAADVANSSAPYLAAITSMFPANPPATGAKAMGLNSTTVWNWFKGISAIPAGRRRTIVKMVEERGRALIAIADELEADAMSETATATMRGSRFPA